jgi:O-acetyl-ADP-ribose deacetylase
MKIDVIQSNIVKLDVDAIVNAANTSLLGGGGVDGAIHRAAGPDLVAECRMLHGCKIGQAKLTRGYRLPARWIIHTVGPVWQGGGAGEASLLAACYRNSLRIANDRDFKSIAFPAISTGIYKFPAARAAAIAVATIIEECSECDDMKVILCGFDETAADVLRQALAATGLASES